MPGNDVAHAPCRLKVEAARHGIHVEHFSGKIKAGILLALHRVDVDVFKRHSATGDKFVLVGAPAADVQHVGSERLHEPVHLLSAHLTPFLQRRKPRFLHQIIPQPLVQLLRMHVGKLPLRTIFLVLAKPFHSALGVSFAQPVDADIGLIAVFGQPARALRREFQHGRAGDAPMGDEQRTGGLQLGGRELACHILDDDAHQVA